MPVSQRFEYQYTYYNYRLKNNNEPHSSLLESYYHYIKWLRTKNQSFTATDLLYQLKVINDHFIKSEDLKHYDKKDLFILNTLVQTNLKNRREYIQSKERRSIWKFCLIGAVGFTLACMTAITHNVAMYFTISIVAINMLGYFCFKLLAIPLMKSKISENDPYTPSFNLFWGILGLAALACLVLYRTMSIGFLTSPVVMLVSDIALFISTVIACESFVKTPITGVEKIPAAADPDAELNTETTNFCQLDNPSEHLRFAVSSTNSCLFNAFRKNYDKPELELRDLEVQLGQRVSSASM